jgi:hypothetical protein
MVMRKTKRGRRPGPTGRPLKDESVTVYYTVEQKQLVERAAASEDDLPANWLRRHSLRVAREVLGIPGPASGDK